MALSPSRKVVVGSKLNITPMKMRDSEDSDWVSEQSEQHGKTGFSAKKTNKLSEK